MSKDNQTARPVKRNEPMNGAMKLFLAGCVAELYLLVLRRLYVTGSVDQMLATYAALPYLAAAGGVVLALGLVLALAVRASSPKAAGAGWWVAGCGAVLGLSALMVRFLGQGALTFLCVLVPVVILLGVFWQLYDRECAWSLSILAASLLVMWICRSLPLGMLGLLMQIGSVCFAVVLVLVLLLVRKADRSGGKVGKIQLLPADVDTLPIYISGGLGIAGVAVALLSASLAYYAMWGLALVVFALAVYYTVKQL